MPPVIDGFADLVEVGRGGFGTVYRAHQLDPAREVAIKVLPDVRADSDAYGRFTREFQALAALGGHPDIATVYACGVTSEGSGYLALELLAGGSLGERLRGAGAVPWGDVAAWGVALSGALETAHRAGITHRDIKPENVLFDTAGTPKLVDFGIAGVPGAYRTATGSVTLTLAHAAPEVVAGGRGGVPGDIYSLASSLYAAVAGAAAFVAEADETLVPMLARIATAPVPDLRPRGVPDSVCSALERGMAKDPADRPASAEAFGMSLQAALVGEGRPCAAPLLLHSPGVAAPFVLSAAAPPIGTTAASAASAASSRGVGGDRTLTGWVPPAPATVPAAAIVSRWPRRQRGMRAAAASLAAVLALLMVWRGLDTPAPAAAGPGPSARPTDSAQPGSPSPSPSPTAAPTTPAASPTAKAATTKTTAAARVPGYVFPVTPASTRPTRKPRTPSSSPTPTPSATPTPSPSPTTTEPPRPPVPFAPRQVRAADAVLVPGASAQVSLSLSWSAAARGPAPSAYEVRWTALGGPTGGTSTVAATVSATSVTLRVPAPPSGTRYRWQVRSVLATEASTWVTARATVPQVLGLRMVPARTTLRAIGLGSSTYRVPAATRAERGRVVAQSLAAGRTVSVGSSVALGIGKAK